jgi:uncharacterized protein (TIGR02099 family)
VSPVLRIIRQIPARLPTFGAWTIIVAGFLAVCTRFAIALATEHPERVQEWLSTALGHEVRFSELEGRWRGLAPEFVLRNVELLDPGGEQKVACFRRLLVAIDLPRTLLSGNLDASSIVVEGARLSVKRRSDGAFSVVGDGGQAQGAGKVEGDELLRWLLEQGRISVRSSEVFWQNGVSDHPQRHFSDVSLSLRNRDDRHRLDISVSLPESLGRRLRVVLEFKGDAGHPQGWQGSAYLTAQGVKVGAWLDDFPIVGARIEGGDLDFEAWGEWQGGSLDSVTGRVRLSNLTLAQSTNRLPKISAIGLIAEGTWRRIEDGWTLAVEPLGFRRGERNWPPSRLAIEVLDGGRSVQAQLGYAQLEDLMPLLAVSRFSHLESLREVERAGPQGAMRDLHLRYERGADGRPTYRYSGRFERVGWGRWRQSPAVNGLTGRFSGDGRRGVIDLQSTTVRVDFHASMPGSLTIDRLSGRLEWSRGASGWQLYSSRVSLVTPDIRSMARFRIELPAGAASPFVDLQIRLGEGDVTAVRSYLPVRFLAPALVKWIDESLVAGRFLGGRALFFGPLSRFPFDEADGRFELQFEVADTVLDYKPGWPQIIDLAAEVRFTGRTMEVQGRRGRIFATELRQARALIPRLGANATLLVIGEAEGPLADGLRYVGDSPLAQRFGSYLSGVEGTGDERVALQLEIPLGRGPPRVRGTVDMAGAQMEFKPHGLRLSAIDGQLSFDEKQVLGEGIRAELDGIAVELSVRPVVSPSGTDSGETSILATGRVNAERLREMFPVFLLDYCVGEVSWRSELRVPNQVRANRVAVALQVESSLEGLDIQLPDPLGKVASDARHLILRTTLSNAPERQLQVEFGHRVRAVFVGATERQRGWVLERGEVRFGGAPAQLPAQHGLRIAGEFERLSLSDWKAFLAGSEDTSAQTRLPLRTLDVSATELAAYGQLFHDVRIDVTERGGVFMGTVQGEDIAGRVELPAESGAAAPVLLDLRRAALVSDARRELSASLTAGPLPPLQVSCAHLSFDGLELGSLFFKTSVRDAAVHLDAFELAGKEYRLRGDGLWISRTGDRRTYLGLILDSESFGHTLRRFGFVPNIEGGEAHFEATLFWPGTPDRFSLEVVSGTLAIRIDSGRVPELEPGVGRAFALLNLDTLRRRLSLDFKDLYHKGFSFDHVEGTFALGDGDAFTEDLSVQAPSADMKIQGRVGFVNRDYDEIITVTLPISTSLSVAGAAAGGPAVGAALLVAQRILGKRVDSISRYRYVVTGPWDEPDVQLVASGLRGAGMGEPSDQQAIDRYKP